MADQTTATHPRTGTHLHDLLGPWVPHQRWYPAKGREARLEVVGTLQVPGSGGEASDDDVRVLVHVGRIVAVDGTGADGRSSPPAAVELVQVPLVHRRSPRTDAAAAAGLLGTLTGDDGTWHVYDGPHDPAFTDALLAVLGGRVRALGLSPSGERDEAAGSAAGRRPAPGAGAPAVPAPGSPARVLRGEQSNTSIIVEPAAGPPVIVKVFRTLHAGRNPDVEVQAALSAAGVPAVPALSAWVEGTWPTGEPAAEGGLVSGDLAVASEFLAGAQDAWREATASIADGTDFAARARDLGATTAAVHRAMAEQLPSRDATPEDATALVAGLRARAAWAAASAPALAPRSAAAAGALDAFEASSDLADLPPLQRVHGDYHLGQVLDVPGRGWVLLDFEGEPLRPLAERTLPDLALRDVAGMLRSFDYAAGSATADPGGGGAQAWAAAARSAFLDGYTAAGGDDPRRRQRLLDALELDKALYEVVYETRNRPDWVSVPLGSIDRLLARLAG